MIKVRDTCHADYLSRLYVGVYSTAPPEDPRERVIFVEYYFRYCKYSIFFLFGVMKVKYDIILSNGSDFNGIISKRTIDE